MVPVVFVSRCVSNAAALWCAGAERATVSNTRHANVSPAIGFILPSTSVARRLRQHGPQSGLSHLEVPAATNSHEEPKDDSATKCHKRGLFDVKRTAYFLVSFVCFAANRCDGACFGYAI
jgi:hypothetical protein